MKAKFSIWTGAAILIWTIVSIFSGLASAQEASVESKVLDVGTKESPPFSMKGADGLWTGISIELWRHIADGLDLKYEFREMALPEILEGVSSGGIDAGIAAITITSEREKKMDFSHAFYSTGLGIAVLEQNRSPWLNVLKRLLSPAFLKVATSLALLLLAVGLLVWALERKKNPGQFGGPTLKGIGSGFWWSAVTMTTVGYGDKAPLTPLGRVVSIVWMFAGVILISGFTAAITASLTVSELTSKVKSPNDLHRFAVGAVSNTHQRGVPAGTKHRLFFVRFRRRRLGSGRKGRNRRLCLRCAAAQVPDQKEAFVRSESPGACRFAPVLRNRPESRFRPAGAD